LLENTKENRLTTKQQTTISSDMNSQVWPGGALAFASPQQQQ